MLINVLYNRGKLACAFAILLSLMFQSSYAAGSGSIKGRVLDKDTGDPLPFVNILVQNTGIGTSTDIEGNSLCAVSRKGSRRYGYLASAMLRKPVK